MRHSILFHCWPALRDRSIPRGHALYIIVLSAVLPNSQNFSQSAGRAAGLQSRGEAERAGDWIVTSREEREEMLFVMRVRVVSMFEISTVPYYPLTFFSNFRDWPRRIRMRPRGW